MSGHSNHTFWTPPTEINHLLDQFSEIFEAPKNLPPKRSPDHQILLKPNSYPFKLKPYRYSHSQKTEIEQQVADMLQAGIIQHSNSLFASLVLLVKKKDRSWRFCVDYRYLNDLTIKDTYQISNINELLNELHGAQVFSKIDLRSRYHQIRIKPKDIPKTVFQTHQGYYEFFGMPFGLTNALLSFRVWWIRFFNPLKEICFRTFLLHFGIQLNSEKYLQHLRTVLNILKENQLHA